LLKEVLPSKFLFYSISLALFLAATTVLTFICYRPYNKATELQKNTQFPCISRSGAIEGITKLLIMEQHVIKLVSLMNFINLTGLSSNGRKILNEFFALLGCYEA
jgi:uncharacterized membrane protein YjfL (UPF0719 family)